MAVDIELMCRHFHWLMLDIHTAEDFEEICAVARELHHR